MTTSTGDEEIDRAIVGLAQSRAQLCAILGNATAANAALATPFPRSAAFRALLSLPAARSFVSAILLAIAVRRVAGRWLKRGVGKP